MKKYVRSSYISEDQKFEYFKKLGGAVEAVANDIYNVMPLLEDDPRSDYFVANIISDEDVIDALQDLMKAIETAVDRQMRRR